MSKHTPEPWAEDQHNRAFIATGGYVTCVHRFISDEDYARAVACVNGCKGIDPAAVPDLLAACKAALADRFGSDDPCVDLDPITNQLRDAIAKAEGGAQ
jgi:hypothetical protein